MLIKLSFLTKKKRTYYAGALIYAFLLWEEKNIYVNSIQFDVATVIKQTYSRIKTIVGWKEFLAQNWIKILNVKARNLSTTLLLIAFHNYRDYNIKSGQ